MQGPEASPRDRGINELVAVVAIGGLSFFVLLWLFWSGFLGSDDELYWDGATGWLTHFPYLGRNHWTLRHTLVVPIALARIVFGNSMIAMFLPTLLYATALIFILSLWTWQSVGVIAAVIATGMVITNPQLVVLSSTASVDIPEAFFVVAAFFVLDRVINARRLSPDSGSRVPLWGLLLVGVFTGLAILSRETATFAVATLGVLFLVGYGIPRTHYLVIAAGCGLVVGLETLWIWSATGNWLYRSAIDLHHDVNISRWVDQGAAIPFMHPLIDPITMLLVNHAFGLVTWLGVPLSIWLLARSVLPGAALRMTVLLSALALVWTLLAAGMWKFLPLIPRYYLLPSLMVSVLAGIALSRLWQMGRRKLASILTILMLLGNLLSLAADNRSYMFGVYALVDLAARQGNVLHTDPQTSRRANLLLDWEQTRDRVTSAPAHRGDLFLYNPTMAGAEFSPGANWIVVERYPIPKSVAHEFVCHLPSGLVSTSMVLKYKCGASAVILFRVS